MIRKKKVREKLTKRKKVSHAISDFVFVSFLFSLFLLFLLIYCTTARREKEKRESERVNE